MTISGDPHVAPLVRHRRSRRRLLLVALLIVIVGGTAGTVQVWRDGPPDVLRTGPVDSPLVGRPAPDFELPDLEDPTQLVSPTALRGRPVLINFWASWCVPCREEMPALEALHQRYSSCVAFIGVDHADERRPAAELVADTGVSYRSGFDPAGTVASEYGLYGLPSTVLLAADGTVDSVYLGPIDPGELGAALAVLAGTTTERAGC